VSGADVLELAGRRLLPRPLKSAFHPKLPLGGVVAAFDPLQTLAPRPVHNESVGQTISK